MDDLETQGDKHEVAISFLLEDAVTYLYRSTGPLVNVLHD